MKPCRVSFALLSVVLTIILCPHKAVAASEEDSLPKDVPSLVKLLHDKSPTVRGEAAHRLGKMRGKAAAAVPALIALLGDDKIGEPMRINYGEVWRDASLALQRIGRPAVAALIKASEDRDATIRARAAWALGEPTLRAKEALPAMLRLLHDPIADVRRSAVRTLGTMEKDGETAVAPLREILKSDRNEWVRAEAIAALSALDRDGKLAIPACIQALKDKSPNVRGLAAEVLGGYGPNAKSAVTALIAMLSDNGTRWLALCPDMGASRPARFDAVTALGKIGRESAAALPELRKMLDEEADTETQAAVAVALLRIDGRDKTAMPALLAMLAENKEKEEEEANFTVALSALESLGPKAVTAIPAVKKALHHELPDVRGAAALALAAIARKEAVPLLIEQLREERRKGEAICVRDKEVYYPIEVSELLRQLVESLGKLGADAAAAVPALSELVADPRLVGFEKETAIEILGNMGAAAKDAVPQLTKMLDSGDGNEQSKAIIALGQIGPAAKAATPRLLKIMNSDPDEDLRESARNALQQIAANRATPNGASH